MDAHILHDIRTPSKSNGINPEYFSAATSINIFQRCNVYMKNFCAAFAVMFVMSDSAHGSDFPASYDLRVLGRVTPVRNQEWLGTCWAFGVMGAVESSYLTKYVSNDASALGGVDSADLSELHMAWYIRNDPDKRWRETSVSVNRSSRKNGLFTQGALSMVRHKAVSYV